MENNPQVVFERLFGDGGTEAERRARREQSRSLLDSVMQDVASLQRQLPAGDRRRIDQYLTDMREIERRIQIAANQAPKEGAAKTAPVGIPDDFERHIKLMFDLQVLAWQADISRVSTLMLAKEVSNATYPGSGIRDPFHNLSHHSNVQQNKDRFAVLNRYHVSMLAYFLEKLKTSAESEGTLLDHSMVLYGSGMSDGNQHNHGPLPVVVCGGGSGGLKGGQHLRAPKGTPLSNLLLSMLRKLDVPAESFGDSTGTIEI